MNQRVCRSIVFLGSITFVAGCHQATVPPVGAQVAVVVPSQGNDTTLDIGQWNLEWFGDTASGHGPTNEALQQSNEHDVLLGANVDLWSVEEVVGRAAWDRLIARMPGYAGVLANDANVVDGPRYYSDFNDKEQKVGLIYRTSVIKVTRARVILTDHDRDFAGRPPLELRLTATLNGHVEDLVVILLHMKAHDDTASWQRRRNASDALKAYLDATYPALRVLVVGDWNDNVNASITPGEPSPYSNFVADWSRYTFVTKVLSDARLTSMVKYPNVIDHQLATASMRSTLLFNSAEVWRVDKYFAAYGETTSDHYPVITRWVVPWP